MFLGLQLELQKIYEIYDVYCKALCDAETQEVALDSFSSLNTEEQQGWKAVLQVAGRYFGQNRHLTQHTYLPLHERQELAYTIYDSHTSAFNAQCSDSGLEYLPVHVQQAWAAVVDELFKIYKDIICNPAIELTECPATLSTPQTIGAIPVKMLEKRLDQVKAPTVGRVDYSNSGIIVGQVRGKKNVYSGSIRPGKSV